MRPSTARALLALGLLALVLVAEPASPQCAMCRTALTGSPEGRSIGAVFNGAILLLFVAPYLVLGGFVAILLRHRIRQGLGRLAAKLWRGGAASPTRPSA